MFEDFAGEANGILDSPEAGGGAGTKGGAVHDDRVAFDAAVEIKMRAEAGIEDGVVFENDYSGFDGVESGAALGED
jgi:hypothetical protein